MNRNFSFFLFSILLFSLVACRQGEDKVHSRDLDEILESDTLRVGTLYGATTYFWFRDEIMGFDYEMAKRFALDLGVSVEFVIANDENELIQLLHAGSVDIIGANIIENKQLKRDFSYVLPRDYSYLVLVQRLSGKSISDVTELLGKTVSVPSGSIYYDRLAALNDELGGGIDIVELADSISSDDLIEQVATKKIDYTVAYHDVALVYKSYFKQLNIHTPIGFRQRSGWLVKNTQPKMLEALRKWQVVPEILELQASLKGKYWEKSPYFAMRKIKIPKGAISSYDHLFKKYAPLIQWDWKLLAALCFQESRFDSLQVSWAGATGLMQLMPRTAGIFGLDANTIYNPELNIEAGVQYIKSLNLAFRKVENKEERIKFILAAYNSGPAHIFDAMALAEKYGANPYIWYDNSEYFLRKLSESEFYNDPVVKFGRFRGGETVHHVRSVQEIYERYLLRK
jgi:membrane-bound lytic murein transglycosylase F